MTRTIEYTKIRGFNYQPSFGSHGLEIWLHNFSANTIRHELSLAKKYFPGINTIRVWLSWDAFIVDSENLVNNFESVLEIIRDFDLRAIVVLFNGWHSVPDFGGISPEQTRYWSENRDLGSTYYIPYIESIVGRFSGDERILMWDLCNEPFNSQERECTLSWLTFINEECRKLDSKTPICVSSIPSIDDVKLVEPISDVLAIHPYFYWADWEIGCAEIAKFLDECVECSKEVGKPLLATETGWGSLDDAYRAKTLRVELGELKKRDVGFTVHLLHHTLVADGHRPEYGFVTSAGYMAMIEADGSLRPHHEVFNEF